ncbi:MipA/OmpV family protein [Asticcacaulis sp. 201]|uniref:MipA/OmpV family protein n=1 Tax=Asticcacaulis sp. 201 TaxID=3028787 RepID=UPI0029168543|nr:MipA/OmpV family protein [Asticcacaulis sp. 201]MDV6330708.1 MipA/OmpV family protein [Asticcacaulis sp. 201]
MIALVTAEPPDAATASIAMPALNWANIDTLVSSGISGDLGVILRRRPQHIGDSRATDELYPVIELKVGDRLQASLDDGIKWTAIKRGKWSLGPVLEYRQSFSDKLPRGAHKMPDAFEAGGFAVYNSDVGDIEMRLRRAINSYQGWSGDVAYDGGIKLSQKTALGIEVRGSWADSNFSEQFFGLRGRHSHDFDLPRVLKNNYFSAGTELTLGHKLDDGTSVFAQASADRIYGEEWRSPILKSRNIFIFSLGMTRHFGAPRAD